MIKECFRDLLDGSEELILQVGFNIHTINLFLIFLFNYNYYQIFLLTTRQIRYGSWGGVFVDLFPGQEVVDRAQIKVVVNDACRPPHCLEPSPLPSPVQFKVRLCLCGLGPDFHIEIYL